MKSILPLFVLLIIAYYAKSKNTIKTREQATAVILKYVSNFAYDDIAFQNDDFLIAWANAIVKKKSYFVDTNGVKRKTDSGMAV